MATEATLSTGIFVAKRFKQSVPAPAPVELFGHVRLVERHGLTNFNGAHAVIELRDHPGVMVAVLTKQFRLQSASRYIRHARRGSRTSWRGARVTPPGRTTGPFWSSGI